MTGLSHLPLFVRGQHRTALVVGGGEVAARKTGLLLRAGLQVTLVAPKVKARIRQLAEEFGTLTLVERAYLVDDLHGIDLLFIATDDAGLNREIAAQARAANTPFNLADDHDGLSDFILPAVIDRSPVIAAVATGARSPALTRLLRARIESVIPAGFGRLADFLGAHRDRVRRLLPEFVQRRRLWESLLDGPEAELVLAGKLTEAEGLLAERLKTVADQSPGAVYLVGAGPGEADLLTLRAVRLIQRADVVVHDRLVSRSILDLARPESARYYVGKERSHHSVPQEEINQLLVDLAGEGKRVVRLKGGDPFIFGRGGEEIAVLANAGIHFEVVPGVTAANGCAAYSGIPLTHRDHTQCCVMMTGHSQNGEVELPWADLARLDATLVVYMGLTGLEQICTRLIEAGKPADTAAAAIQRGTTAEQKVVTATLADLPAEVRNADLQAPVLLIIGSVVGLREELDWFGV
ncbi:MAG: siroheme synthase CysG [Gammaproteobacteria bacterium]|nr:siroheme synthase CysG [Gammaproteobacteria bacterium]